MMMRTELNRIYRQRIVSNLTLNEIEKMFDDEVTYSGDYGFKAYDKDVRLVFSLN